MAFRDDREALRSKAQVLEADVQDLREELARARAALAAHEEKDESDQAELARLRAEVTRLDPEKEVPSPTPDVTTQHRSAILAGVFVFAAGIAVLFLAWQASHGEKPVENAPSPPTPRHLPPPAPSPGRAPIAPGPLDVMRFGAVVASAEGSSLSAGDACVIEAEVSASHEVGRVWVWCDDLLYDSTMSGGTEMTAHESHVNALELELGRYVYTLSVQDTGMRTGPRPQIAIDTGSSTTRVWRDDTATPLDVRLFVEDRSAPVSLASASEASRASGLVEVRARAVPRHARGSRTGGPCDLRVHAEERGQPDCRVLLRCPSGMLYGGATLGYGSCEYDAAPTPAGFRDDQTSAIDGDPWLDLRVNEGLLTIRDDVDGVAWQEELRLEEDPRCNFDGRWRGRLRTEAGEMAGVSLDPTATASTTVTLNGRVVTESRSEGAPVLRVPGHPSGEAHVELDCGRGVGTLVVDGARYRGRFGPDFATFLGEREGEEHALLWLRRAPTRAPSVPELDLSQVPPAAREAVRRTLREAQP